MFLKLKLFKKQTKEYMALDIGSQNTKIITFSPQGAINRFVIEPTPEKTFDAGIILDVGKLSEFLMVCIGKMDIVNDVEIITGVSGKGFITKKIDMPNIEEHLIVEHLPFEAEQYLPYEIDEMNLDYEILKGIETNSSSDTPLLLIAVLKNIVSQYDTLFDKSFVTCNILDSNVFALFNIFEKNYDLDETKNYFLMDIGFNMTNLVGVVKNQVVFTRSLPVGGDFHTQELQRILDLGHSEAEDLKKNVNGEDYPENVSSDIQNTINPLFSNEIFSGYELYLSFFPENQASEIYVTGGGSQVLGLLDALTDKFNIPVHPIDPFQTVKLDSELKVNQEKFVTFGAVVAGLSLRVT